MSVLTVRQGNTVFEIPFDGTPLLKDVLHTDSPCGGRGTCGKCKVQLSGHVSPPNDAERRAGCRLACQAILLGDACAELAQERSARIETETGRLGEKKLGTYGIAADIGTTTVVMALLDQNGTCVAKSACFNPQRTVAADVIGRIDAAMHGKADLLRDGIEDCLSGLLSDVCAQAGISERLVEKAVLTGNTAMLYLLTGRSPASIAHAPFRSETMFGEQIDFRGIPALLPPCMDAFVGADITCALLASDMTADKKTALLCDIGTNGEIALWKDGKLLVTSTAAGPAFEGAEISCGCGSVSGAIDRVYAANGRVYAHTIDETKAIGICGSGLVDAVGAFLETGEIDETGASDGDLLLAANGGTVTLTQADIRALQLAKAAVRAGMDTLLRYADTSADAVDAFYLAGGFGNHLPMRSAVRIGLLPQALAGKAVLLGNAALTGAIRLLLDPSRMQDAACLAALAHPVSLGGNADFNAAFVENMLF